MVTYRPELQGSLETYAPVLAANKKGKQQSNNDGKVTDMIDNDLYDS